MQGDLAVDGKTVVSAPVPADWWRLYKDPRLDQLVQQAMASNTDLRVAAASLSRSRAQVDEAEAAGGWSGGVKMGAQRLQESGQAFLIPEKVPVANVGDIGISASYQFDLFGTLQRGIEAAKANADATQAAADTARITVVADVVRAYTQVCAANEEREIAQHSLDLQAQSTTLIQRLRDAGRGDETQVTRSQTQFKSLRADMPRYEASRQAGLYPPVDVAGQAGGSTAGRHRHLRRAAENRAIDSGGRWRRLAQASSRCAAGRAPAGGCDGRDWRRHG